MILLLSLLTGCDPAAWWGSGNSWIPRIPEPERASGGDGAPENGEAPSLPEGNGCADPKDAVCQAARAKEIFNQGDVEEGLRAARSIPDGALRDLVLSEAVRSHGWNLCDEIVSDNLRERCRTNVTRPHLRLPGNAGPGAITPATPLPAGLAGSCDGLEPTLRDQCLNQQVDLPTDLDAAGRICDAITDGDTRGDCMVRLADRQTDAGSLDVSRSICARAPDGRWRDECWFRLSERVRGLEPDQRLALCGEAGAFRYFCTMHLASHYANEGVLGLGQTTFSGAVESLAGTEAALSKVLVDAGVPRDAAGREFWVQAWHDLLLEVGSGEDLGRWRNLGPRIQGSDAAVALYPDLLAMAWARLQALQMETVPPGPNVAARDVGAWVAVYDDAVLSSSSRPRDPADNLIIRPDAVDRPIPVPGKYPMALDPRGDCKLNPVERTSVALLWGLGPAPWPVSERLLTSALESPNVGVRSAAMEILEEKTWTWRLADGPPPAWLGALVARREAAEPVVRLKTRAGQLREALGAGNRPAAWSVPADRLCEAE